jgi:hypothetical protein
MSHCHEDVSRTELAIFLWKVCRQHSRTVIQVHRACMILTPDRKGNINSITTGGSRAATDAQARKHVLSIHLLLHFQYHELHNMFPLRLPLYDPTHCD